MSNKYVIDHHYKGFISLNAALKYMDIDYDEENARRNR